MKALKKVPGDKKGLSKLPTAVRNKMGYMKKGGKVVNPDDKVRPEVGRWYMKQSKEIKSLFDNAYDSAYKRGASGAQARESAIKAIEKKTGKTIEFKGGGKVFKAHKMYKDGKSVMANTMEDHLRLKKQGYSHKK